MAAEYSAVEAQVVTDNSPVIFTESPVPCNRGLIFHRDGSGIFRLSSVGARRPSCCCLTMPEAQYLVEFHGNVALPTGGTVEADAIQLAIAIDGEIDSASIMITTPAAVEEFESIGTSVIVSVPAMCRCSSISVRNISGQDITVQNANLLVDRIGARR